MLFRGFGAHSNGTKKVIKGRQVGGRYVPMSKLESKPLTKSSGLFLKEKVSKTTKKLFFYAVLGHLGTPKWTKKVLKSAQVDGMYDPMS